MRRWPGAAGLAVGSLLAALTANACFELGKFCAGEECIASDGGAGGDAGEGGAPGVGGTGGTVDVVCPCDATEAASRKADGEGGQNCVCDGDADACWDAPWIKHLDGAGDVRVDRVFGDGADGVYVIGRFTDELRVLDVPAGEPVSLRTDAPGSTEAFVLRLTGAGSVLWLRRYGGATGNEAACATPDGSTCPTCQCADAGAVGGATTAAVVSVSHAAAAAERSRATEVAVVIGGTFSGTLHTPLGEHVSADDDVFALRLDDAGCICGDPFIEQHVGEDELRTLSVTDDEPPRVVAFGRVAGADRTYASRCDWKSDGVSQSHDLWMMEPWGSSSSICAQIGQNDSDDVWGEAVVQDGVAWLTGGFEAAPRLLTARHSGGDLFGSPTGADVFVLGIGVDGGAPVWAWTVGAAGRQEVTALVAGDGEVLVGGVARDGASMPGFCGTVSSDAMFMAQLDTTTCDPTPAWARHHGGVGVSEVSAAARHEVLGSVVGGTLAEDTLEHGALMWLDAAGAPRWVGRVETAMATTSATVTSIHADANGVFAGGIVVGDGVYTLGEESFTATGTDAFVARLMPVIGSNPNLFPGCGFGSGAGGAGGDDCPSGAGGAGGATCDVANGSPCTHGQVCASGQCFDGVCCDVACDGVCANCNATSPGVCTLTPSGQDPDDECAGACDGSGQCAP